MFGLWEFFQAWFILTSLSGENLMLAMLAASSGRKVETAVSNCTC